MCLIGDVDDNVCVYVDVYVDGDDNVYVGV